MLGWIVSIALETGMQSSEITGLRRHQVDVEKRIACLLTTKNDSARTVPLSKLAAAALTAALNNPVRPIDTHLIFLASLELGIPDFRFHDLRHEAVSRLVESGLSDQEVRRQADISRCKC